MILKYYLKQQPKIMFGIAAVFMLIVLAFNISNMVQEWYILSSIIALLTIFFTGNIFSSEIENKTDFLIFTSRTPRYKILIQKYLSAWIICEIVVAAIYISAVIMEFEKSFFGLMALILYSTVLSLIALLFSNITGKTLVGYGAALSLWSLEMMLNTNWHESHPLLALNINLLEKSVQVWSNILFMIVLILVLVILNLFLVSKGEHLRKNLVYKGTSIVIIISLICLFSYNYFFLKLEFWNDNNWKVLKEENIILHYKNLDNKRGAELLRICSAEVASLENMYHENICFSEFYTFNVKDKISLKKGYMNNAYVMPIKSLKSFNSVDYHGEYWYQSVSRILMEPVFKNIKNTNENEILKDAWENYIYFSYINHNIENKLKENIMLVQPIYYSKGDYAKGLEDDFNSVKESEKEKHSIHSLGTMSRVLLYKLDKENHEDMIKLLKDIQNSKKSLSYNDIQNIIKKYYKSNSVNEVLKIYNEVKIYHEKYYNNKGVVVES
ncbi:ABC transporter permease [Clostridium sp. P21]|uniref:ABC transporter permease n=1 Tax=Clostridium muellerianum TaxID=2716538 RepID=A0A7Y0HLD9_9CLOT|nr:ABC transporter permease [Clostridium muellerianum]NMM61799.1 ABC transporter permease [Clostridium muellerianum]